MERTQIQLTNEQARGLRELASERGVSMATLIREAVDDQLAAREQRNRLEHAMSYVGKFRSGLPDLAQRHDDYLAEDFLP